MGKKNGIGRSFQSSTLHPQPPCSLLSLSFSLSIESTAAMDSEEGTQQLHLALAHKLFLLRHLDVRTSRRSASKMRSSPPLNPTVTHHQFFNDSLRVIPPIPPHITFFWFLFLFLCRYGSVV